MLRSERTSMLTIRPATAADVPVILHFIRELAAYERQPDAVDATEADLLRDGFGLAPDGVTPITPAPPPRFWTLIAELSAAANEPAAPAGFALCFSTYSTWEGHHGIFLEDLYVPPELRGRGIGKALLVRVAQIAVEQGCGRVNWHVLDWNEPSIAVYERLGARFLSEWRIMRLSGDSLAALANLR